VGESDLRGERTGGEKYRRGVVPLDVVKRVGRFGMGAGNKFFVKT